MDALRWVLLGVMGLELTTIVALLGANCRLHARTGRPLDFARGRRVVIELSRPVQEAEALCREAGRSTSLRLRVALNALDGRRTRVAVMTRPGILYRFTRQRAAELDRLAAWLVQHGGGQVVAMGFGKPR
jgi:hypothetical protein